MTFPVECPNCGKTFQAVNGLIGKEAKCKKCQRVFTVEAPSAPEPPPVPVPPPLPQTHSAQAVLSKPASINGVVLMCTLFGAMGGGIGVIGGAVLAEYLPLFGGFMATVAEPFSPYRNSLVLGHAILCGMILGILGATVGGILWAMTKR